MIITAEVLDRPQIVFTPRPSNFSEISPLKRAISPPLHDKKKKAKTADIMPCPQTLILNSNNTIPSQMTTASIFLSPPGDDSNNVTKLKCDPFVITATITSPHIRVHPSLSRRGSNHKIKEKGTTKETQELLNKLNGATFSKDFVKNDIGRINRTEGNPVHLSLAKERRKSPFSSCVTAKENTQPSGSCSNQGNEKNRKTSNIFLRLGGSRRNSEETSNLKSRPTILGSNSSSQQPQIRSKDDDEETSVPFQKSHPLRHTLGTTRVINRSRPGPSQIARGNNSPIRSSPLSTRTNNQKGCNKNNGVQCASAVSARPTTSSNLNDFAVLTRLRNEYNKNKDKDNITEEPAKSRNNSVTGTFLRIRNNSLTFGGSSASKRPSISVLQNNIAFVNELRNRNNSLTNGELRTRNNSLTSVVNFRPGSRNNSVTETSATSFTNKKHSVAARPNPNISNTATPTTANVAGKPSPGSSPGRGRQGKSPAAKVVGKRANKRMDKTVTTQKRTFQKSGQWFEETVETTVVENKDGSRTTTKTTTKQLPGPPSTAGSSQRARSSSSSSSSRSPSPQRSVKNKDSSAGSGLFSRFRTKKDSSSSDDDQDDFDKTFSKDVLEAINEKRSKHGAKGLKMSCKLTHEARQWAKHLASKDKMQHKQDQQFGENIYRLSANLPVDKTVASGKQIVDQWYSEADKHKFGQEPSGAKLETGHFTQIVWKDSKELGVGIALSDTKRNIYVVAFFSPKGNWMGEFATKVPPVGGFPPSSAKKGGLTHKISKISVASSSSSDEDEDFNEAVLKAHNQYRAKHGVPPLKLSKKLNKFAEEWATKIAKRDRMEHRSNNEYGENLYAKWNSKPNHTIPGMEAVESWYSEITDHTFGKEPSSLASGHFTQVIWEDSKELGVGLARNKTSGKLYVVCNYEPAGNMVGSFAKKVPPPKK